MTHLSANLVQVGFRGRSGDSVALNNGTTWAAAENTGWTQDIDAEPVIRIRLEVEENGGASGTASGQLEYDLNNSGTFNPVTTTSSVIRAIASGQFNEDDATTNILGSGAGTFVAGSGSEDGDGIDVALLSQHTEWEFCLQIQAADVADNDTIQLRINGLNSYTNTATITVSEASVGATVAALAGDAASDGSLVIVQAGTGAISASPTGDASADGPTPTVSAGGGAVDVTVVVLAGDAISDGVVPSVVAETVGTDFLGRETVVDFANRRVLVKAGR